MGDGVGVRVGGDRGGDGARRVGVAMSGWRVEMFVGEFARNGIKKYKYA